MKWPPRYLQPLVKRLDSVRRGKSVCLCLRERAIALVFVRVASVVCVCACMCRGISEFFPPSSRLCTCVFYVREMCSVCKCLCAQRLPSYYVCFTAGQSFTGRALWHVLRAISVQIYWFIMAKQVQHRMGRYMNSTSGSHTMWRLKANS